MQERQLVVRACVAHIKEYASVSQAAKQKLDDIYEEARCAALRCSCCDCARCAVHAVLCMLRHVAPYDAACMG